MKILGISAFYHDSAAALCIDGNVVGASQEERFTRKKHDSSYPEHSIAYCLKAGNLQLKDIDYFVFYEKPFLKFDRLIETYLAFAPLGFTSFQKSMPLWFHEKLFQKNSLLKALRKKEKSVPWSKRLLFSEHHLSHAASAFFPSPFESAAVLTMDGVGEWTTTSLGIGEGSNLNLIQEIHFPHSLGLLYSAFTYFLGFKVNSGEYKVMGLAPYGSPRYCDLILKELIDVKDDGSFRLNLKYFDFCTGLKMISTHFESLFGIPTRGSESALDAVHMDIAASLQKVVEEVVLKLCHAVKKETGQKNLCLAGGVALNCVANGKILKEKLFDSIWIQPAAGDAGGALGAALAAYHVQLGGKRKVNARDSMKGSYLGPSYTAAEIRRELESAGAVFEELSDDEFVDRCASLLTNGKAMGWFQDRMEFGPRALGSRSIIADARHDKMQTELNLKIKFRESFRPFAPIVLKEDCNEWFDLDCDCPYMLLVAPVKEQKRLKAENDESLFGIEKLKRPRSKIPAVTHVDYSARVQTIHPETNPRLHELLTSFKQKTGCGVLVNTSFNIRGEPIVCSPTDAFRCFMGTELDVLAIGNFLLLKEQQNPTLRQDYRDQFVLD